MLQDILGIDLFIFVWELDKKVDATPMSVH